MATTVVVSAPLCLAVNMLKRYTVKDIKSLIVNFYDSDSLAAAKRQIVSDSDGLADDLPRLPRRQDSTERGSRECDDILTMLNFLDERLVIDKLPTYVVDNPDSMPSVRFAEGDFRLFLDKMTKMEATLEAMQD
jgi:hypothetical protein